MLLGLGLEPGFQSVPSVKPSTWNEFPHVLFLLLRSNFLAFHQLFKSILVGHGWSRNSFMKAFE